MTTAPRFSRQNVAGLRVALWENLVLVVVLDLESKGPNCYIREFKKLRRQLQGKRHIKIELCV